MPGVRGFWEHLQKNGSDVPPLWIYCVSVGMVLRWMLFGWGQLDGSDVSRNATTYYTPPRI